MKVDTAELTMNAAIVSTIGITGVELTKEFTGVKLNKEVVAIELTTAVAVVKLSTEVAAVEGPKRACPLHVSAPCNLYELYDTKNYNHDTTHLA